MTTNGTIYPEEEIWALLCNYKITIRVSGYNNNVAPKRKKLIDRLHKEKINTEDLEGMKWYDVGDCKKKEQKKARTD